MPATALTVRTISKAKTLITAGVAADATNGNSYVQDGHTTLIAKNGGGVTYTLSVTVVADADGNAISPLVYSIAAGEEVAIPPLPTAVYGSTVTVTANNAAVLLKAHSAPPVSRF